VSTGRFTYVTARRHALASTWAYGCAWPSASERQTNRFKYSEHTCVLQQSSTVGEQTCVLRYSSTVGTSPSDRHSVSTRSCACSVAVPFVVLLPTTVLATALCLSLPPTVRPYSTRTVLCARVQYYGIPIHKPDFSPLFIKRHDPMLQFYNRGKFQSEVWYYLKYSTIIQNILLLFKIRIFTVYSHSLYGMMGYALIEHFDVIRLG
jgi:hypothetical protein